MFQEVLNETRELLEAGQPLLVTVDRRASRRRGNELLADRPSPGSSRWTGGGPRRRAQGLPRTTCSPLEA